MQSVRCVNVVNEHIALRDTYTRFGPQLSIMGKGSSYNTQYLPRELMTVKGYLQKWYHFSLIVKPLWD